MILWNPKTELTLRDFGILVPSPATRARKIRESLLTDVRFADLSSAWLKEVSVDPATREMLCLAHHEAFISRALDSDPDGCVIECYELLDKSGNPYRYDPQSAFRPLKDIVTNERYVAATSTFAGEYALRTGFAYFLGGGWHHSVASGGRGFCLFNDIVIAVKSLQQARSVKQVWVIDTDAHKGDGTAALTVGDESILTLSIHMARGWPLDDHPLDKNGNLKEWWYPSTIDIPVPDGGEHLYLELLQMGLHNLTSHSPKAPDLVVVVNGSDPYEADGLPGSRHLRLTLPTLLERDMIVYEHLEAMGVPHVWLMSGGYGEEVWKVHAQFLADILAKRLSS